MVVPVQRDRVFIKWGCGTKINVANLASGTGVATDGHKQALGLACAVTACMLPEPNVVAQRSTQENVVPGCDGERWHLDIGEVLLNRPTLPVIVVTGMRQPIQKVRCKRPKEINVVRRRW